VWMHTQETKYSSTQEIEYSSTHETKSQAEQRINSEHGMTA